MNMRRNQRRRRVIYNAMAAGDQGVLSRRQTERLRQARKPTEAYGRRVHRRLDARWFSIVPVRRVAMTQLASVATSIAVLFTLGHAATEMWPWLANRPAIGRVLRIERVDSLASCTTTLMWMVTAAMALLVYQLRRYRLDDYRGQYRLWRWVLAGCVAAGLNQSIGLVDWSGQIVEALAGRRIGISGTQWMRLIVTMASAALWVRLMIDIRASQLSAAALVVAGLAAALPETVRWNVWAISSPAAWVAITAAPVWVVTATCVAVTAYLRLVYRDVLAVDDKVSLRLFRPKLLFGRSGADADDQAADDQAASIKAANDKAANNEAADKEASPPRRSRAMAALRRMAPQRWIGSSANLDAETADSADPDAGKKPSRRKSRAAAAAKVAAATKTPPPAEQPEPVDEDVSAGGNDSVGDESTVKRRRFALPKLFGRRKVAATAGDDEGSEDSDSAGNRPGVSASTAATSRVAAQPQPTPSRSDSMAGANGDLASNEVAESTESVDAAEFIDPDDIDWDSLSKTERRRLRKQLKRQGRAA